MNNEYVQMSNAVFHQGGARHSVPAALLETGPGAHGVTRPANNL